MYCIHIKDFDDWRVQARELLKRGVSPDSITWQSDKQSPLLFDDNTDYSSLKIIRKEPTISRQFFQLAKYVACYRDDNRWALLYSLAWRLIFEDEKLLNFKIDPLVSRLNFMHKTIARDKHKMEAFVRFRKVNDAKNEQNKCTEEEDINNEEYYVAWFEPEHPILPVAISFFVKRFNNMCWSILTPDACAHWNTAQLTFTKGIARAPQLEDELEELWRQYYASIFNPARLKLKAMQSEMPKKYWVNLPEAPLISELTRNAGKRVDKMIKDSETPE